MTIKGTFLKETENRNGGFESIHAIGFENQEMNINVRRGAKFTQ